MKKLSAILSFAFILGVSFSVPAVAASDDSSNKTAQHSITVSIPSHALVGLSSTSAITLEPSAPTTAGEGLDFSSTGATDNSIWLNYSSIISKSSNTISVNMTDSNLPEGVSIELTGGEDNGQGKGTVGSPSEDAITLSTKSQNFITGIKNCYTGTGSKAGHQLTYTLTMDDDADYEELTSGDYSTTIVYTITEN